MKLNENQLNLLKEITHSLLESIETIKSSYPTQAGTVDVINDKTGEKESADANKLNQIINDEVLHQLDSNYQILSSYFSNSNQDKSVDELLLESLLDLIDFNAIISKWTRLLIYELILTNLYFFKTILNSDGTEIPSKDKRYIFYYAIKKKRYAFILDFIDCLKDPQTRPDNKTFLEALSSIQSTIIGILIEEKGNLNEYHSLMREAMQKERGISEKLVNIWGKHVYLIIYELTAPHAKRGLINLFANQMSFLKEGLYSMDDQSREKKSDLINIIKIDCSRWVDYSSVMKRSGYDKSDNSAEETLILLAGSQGINFSECTDNTNIYFFYESLIVSSSQKNLSIKEYKSLLSTFKKMENSGSLINKKILADIFYLLAKVGYKVGKNRFDILESSVSKIILAFEYSPKTVQITSLLTEMLFALMDGICSDFHERIKTKYFTELLKLLQSFPLEEKDLNFCYVQLCIYKLSGEKKYLYLFIENAEKLLADPKKLSEQDIGILYFYLAYSFHTIDFKKQSHHCFELANTNHSDVLALYIKNCADKKFKLYFEKDTLPDLEKKEGDKNKNTDETNSDVMPEQEVSTTNFTSKINYVNGKTVVSINHHLPIFISKQSNLILKNTEKLSPPTIKIKEEKKPALLPKLQPPISAPVKVASKPSTKESNPPKIKVKEERKSALLPKSQPSTPAWVKVASKPSAKESNPKNTKKPALLTYGNVTIFENPDNKKAQKKSSISPVSTPTKLTQQEPLPPIMFRRTYQNTKVLFYEIPTMLDLQKINGLEKEITELRMSAEEYLTQERELASFEVAEKYRQIFERILNIATEARLPLHCGVACHHMGYALGSKIAEHHEQSGDKKACEIAFKNAITLLDQSINHYRHFLHANNDQALRITLNIEMVKIESQLQLYKIKLTRIEEEVKETISMHQKM